MFGCGRKKLGQKRINKEFQTALENIKKDPLMGLDKDSIKAKYGNKFFELRNIININDPEGLISIGAPEDEYEAEVKTIIVQLDSNKTEKDILELVYNEFTRWFGNAGDKNNYQKIASDIYKWQNDSFNK